VVNEYALHRKLREDKTEGTLVFEKDRNNKQTKMAFQSGQRWT